MICMVKCAIFDLDGTLVDTSVDLGRATAYVLEQFGITPKWSDDDYRSFVGNGARKLLERAFEYKLGEDELDRAFEMFKSEYNEILNDNAFIYDGVIDSLDVLKKRGLKLAVVTNKPHHSAIIMLEKLFGSSYFDFIIGASEDKPKKPDPCCVNIALSNLNCSPDDAVFIGDSDVDIQTARNAGLKAVACSWGFRAVETLSLADIIINHPSQIKDVL